MGIFGGNANHPAHRLPQEETNYPEAGPNNARDDGDNEGRGGHSVHLDVATSEDPHTTEDPENAQEPENLEQHGHGEPQAAAAAEPSSPDGAGETAQPPTPGPARVTDTRSTNEPDSKPGYATDEPSELPMSRADMQDLMDSFDRAYRQPQHGDVVEGQVVRIDKDGVLVDIGTKSEGIIPSYELQGFGINGLDEIKVGDSILVYVVQTENQQGHVVLSLRKARAERGWRTAQKRFDEGSTVEAKVTDHNRGGLIVNLDGVRGFVPVSQVVGLRQDRVSDEEMEKRMAEMIGKTMTLKVIEVNRSRNRLILSERQATQEIRAQRKEQLLNELKEGEIRHGRVSSVCDFGAFVDLGGADGLVHLSELSWSSVSHPSEVVKVGDEVDVQVLGVDQEKKKIALSLRRSQPGPWTKVGEKYKVGDLVSGRITKLATFGAFARIEDGVEGLIHVSELSEGRVAHPKNVVKEGDVVTLRIIRIDAEHRRLGLSLKQALGEEPGPARVEEPAEAPESSSITAVPSEATEANPSASESDSVSLAGVDAEGAEVVEAQGDANEALATENEDQPVADSKNEADSKNGNDEDEETAAGNEAAQPAAISLAISSLEAAAE